METVLVNLSNELYKESRYKLNNSAKKFDNIHKIISYDFNDIKDTEFYRVNREILDQPKGIGYWLWKPHIILKAFDTLVDGDVVIYCDAGLEVLENLQPLIDICVNKSPIVLFGNANQLNYEWTKRDCFILMDCDDERYWYGPHVDAAFSLWKKGDTALNFLKDWMKFGSDARIITDLPNSCGKENLAGFIDHRWDQSILSILASERKLDLYRMPTQFGNHYKEISYRVEGEFNCVNQSQQQQVGYYHHIPYYNSPYGQILNHHRGKNKTLLSSSIDEKSKPINWISKIKPSYLLKKLFFLLGYKIVKKSQ